MKQSTVIHGPAKRPCPRPPSPNTDICGDRQRCIPDEDCEVQHFPTEEDQLFANLNLDKAELESRIAGLPGKVRRYTMTSVIDDQSGRFQQTGTGPNYQGGLLTLCTCKHKMRAEKKTAEEWQGCWIAGFTATTLQNQKVKGRSWLFYLAQVRLAYSSQDQLYRALDEHVRQAKSARHHRLGDVYEPRPSSACHDVWNAAHYYSPKIGHDHHASASDDGWKGDIEATYWGRHPVLLLAEPELTFLWQEPLLSAAYKRNATLDNVALFLAGLQAAE